MNAQTTTDTQTSKEQAMDTTPLNDTINVNIIGHILAAGWTIGGVADALDLGRAELRSTLAGRGGLTVGLISGIADTIGVKPSELIDVTDRTPWDPRTLQGMKTVIIPDDRGRELELWTDDGETFRHAFEIEINIDALTATIRMFKGAASGDITIAQGNLRLVRQVGFDCHWAEESRDGAECWILSKLQFGEGKAHGYPQFDNELRPCLDEACTRALHEWSEDDEGVEVQEDPCTLEPIVGSEGCYSVGAGTTPTGKWEVSADVELPDGPAAVKVAQDLLNDLRWVQAEVDRLNDRRREAIIKNIASGFDAFVKEVTA